MRWTSWKAALVVLLACTGLAWGQNAAGQGERYLMVGDPPQKCRVLASWRMEDGRRAYDVQSVSTGEMLTLYEVAPLQRSASGGLLTKLRMRIGHWGNSTTRPAGFPAPPAGGANTCCACNDSSASQETDFGTPMSGSADSTSPYAPSTTSRHAPSATSRRIAASSTSPYAPSTVSLGLTAQGPCCCGNSTASTSGSPCACDVAGSGAATVSAVPYLPAGPPSMKIVPQEEGMPPVYEGTPTSSKSSLVKTKPGLSKAPTLSDLARQSGPQVAPTPLPPAPAAPSSAPPPQAAWTQQWANPNPTLATPPEPPAVPDLPPAPAKAATSSAVPPPPPASAYPQAAPLPSGPAPTPAGTSAPGKQSRSGVVSAYASGALPVAPPAFPVARPTAPPLPASRTYQPGASDPLRSDNNYLPPTAEKKLAQKTGQAQTELAPATGTSAKAKPTVSPASQPTTDPLGGRMPPGAASVLAAYDGKEDGIRYLPVPIVTMPQPNTPPKPPAAPAINPPKPPDPFANAFSPPTGQGQAEWRNAFSPLPSRKAAQPEPGSPMPIAQYPMAPGMMPYPPAYAMARYPYPSMMPGMAPYTAASAPMPPNGLAMVPASYNRSAAPTYANPAMDRPGLPVALPTRQVNAETVQKMASVLKNSLYPSQREWAVEYLASLDWHTHEQVVPALLTAAREDPAPTVRLACIHCLARMNVNADLVRGTLQALHSDPDAGVRAAADQALVQLSPAAGPAVQPVSGVNP